MDPATLLLAAPVVVFAALVQGVTGLGFGLVTAPVLLMIEPALVPGVVLVLDCAVTVLVLARDRSGLRAADIGPALAGSLPGAALGVVAVGLLSGRFLAVTLGGAVMAAVAATWFGLAIRQHRGTLAAAGSLAGFMGTTVATPGPPMAVAYRPSDPVAGRANLCGFFLCTGAVSLVLLVAGGRFDGGSARAAAVLVPFAVAGFAASGRPARHLSVERVTQGVLVLAFAAAAAVLVRGLAG